MIESSRMIWAGHKAYLEYSFLLLHLVVLEYLADVNVDGRTFEKRSVWVSTVFNRKFEMQVAMKG
jgi:hypothetical protein